MEVDYSSQVDEALPKADKLAKVRIFIYRLHLFLSGEFDYGSRLVVRLGKANSSWRGHALEFASFASHCEIGFRCKELECPQRNDFGDVKEARSHQIRNQEYDRGLL